MTVSIVSSDSDGPLSPASETERQVGVDLLLSITTGRMLVPRDPEGLGNVGKTVEFMLWLLGVTTPVDEVIGLPMTLGMYRGWSRGLVLGQHPYLATEVVTPAGIKLWLAEIRDRYGETLLIRRPPSFEEEWASPELARPL